MSQQNITTEEISLAHDAVLRGADAASRLASYIGSMKITEETNALYKDALEVWEECSQAGNYIFSLFPPVVSQP